jgi:serine/threonine-protein kinase PRP4
VTLLGEDDENSPLGRTPRRRTWLRTRRKKASEYRKKKFNQISGSNLSFRISPRSHSSAKEPVPPISNTESTVVEMELDLAPSPPPVEDILAARCAKRQAILAKYSGVASVNTSISPSPGPSSAAQPPTHSLSVSNRVSVSPTSCDFALAKDSEQEGRSRPENAGGEQVSAADYDPSLDRREDEYKRLGDKVTNVETIDEEVEEEEDVEDMFAIASSNKKVKKVKKIIVSSAHWYEFPITDFFLWQLETISACSNNNRHT